MTGITKGATVRALKHGKSSIATHAVPYRKDDELLVLYVRKDDHLKVRHVSEFRFNTEFLIHVSDVEGPLRPLGVVPEGSISPDDPRLDYLWEDAERVANMSGFCVEYDHLLKALNLPGRMRTHTVKLATGDGIEIVAKIRARSMRQAEERLRRGMHDHRLTDISIDGHEVVIAELEEQK